MAYHKTKPTGRPRSLSRETEQRICDEARTDPLFSFAEVGRRYGTTDGTVRATLIRYHVPFPPKRYSLYSFPTTRYWKTRNTAIKRGLDFTLTMDDLEDLFQKQDQRCPYTGWKLTFASSTTAYDGTASLDRIDSSKGYVKGNVQWVNKHVNLMKNAHTHEDFVELCKAIARQHGTWEPVQEITARVSTMGCYPTNAPKREIIAKVQNDPLPKPSQVDDTSLLSDDQ